MKTINIISLRVIAVFVTAMFFSFIPEYIPNFFQDWICQGRNLIRTGEYSSYTGCDYSSLDLHNPTKHWGYRHWLFFIMGLILLIIQAIDIINYANKNK